MWKPIEVSPTLTVFSLWSDGQTNETKVVRIVNNLETPLTLSDLQCTNQAFPTEVATVREGKEFELRISTGTPIESSSVNSTVTG